MGWPAQRNEDLERLLETHRQINERVRHIRLELDRLANRLPAPTEIHQLSDKLRRLYTELARHFDEEQQGGTIKEAISRNPKVADEADRLFGEHAGLLESLMDVHRGLDKSIEVIQSISKLAGDFHAFAEALLTHEAFENHILEQGRNVAPQ